MPRATVPVALIVCVAKAPPRVNPGVAPFSIVSVCRRAP